MQRFFDVFVVMLRRMQPLMVHTVTIGWFCNGSMGVAKVAMGPTGSSSNGPEGFVARRRALLPRARHSLPRMQRTRYQNLYSSQPPHLGTIHRDGRGARQASTRTSRTAVFLPT